MRRLPGSRSGLALVFSLALASERAVAESAVTQTILILPSCSIEGVTEHDVRELLEAELYADGIRLAKPGSGLGSNDALLEVRSSCQPNAPLSIRGSLGPYQQMRELGLAELPAHARPRALALSLAELLEQLARQKTASPDAEPAASSAPAPAAAAEEQPPPAEAPPAEAPPVTPAAPKLAAPAPRPPRQPSPRQPAPRQPAPRAAPPALVLSPELRWFAPDSPLFGARVSVEPGAWTLGLDLLAAKSLTDSGLVSATLVHGILGFAPLRIRSAGGLASLSAGARVGLGLLDLDARANAGSLSSVSNDPYFDAALEGRGQLELGSGFSIGLALELGACRGATALVDAVRIASYDGPFVSGLLRFGLEL